MLCRVKEAPCKVASSAILRITMLNIMDFYPDQFSRILLQEHSCGYDLKYRETIQYRNINQL